MIPADWLDQLRANYPRRSGGQGWAALPRLLGPILHNDGVWQSLLAGAKSYRSHCDREGLTGTEFVMQARTFFGRDRWWEESYEPEARPKLPAELALERRWQALKDRAGYAGFRQPTEIELKCDPSAFEGQLKNFERNQPSNVTTIPRKIQS